MYALKAPAVEVAQALLIVMPEGSLRAAEEIMRHREQPDDGERWDALFRTVTVTSRLRA